MPIALLTEARYVRPGAPPAPHHHVDLGPDVFADDGLLVGGLVARGVSAERVDWADPEVDWSRFEVGVFRTTWDYFERFPEFLAWLDRIEPVLETVNPLPLIRWNLDKGYLLDLGASGVPIVPTVRLDRGADVDLADLARDHGWDRLVIKPAVSGAAYETWHGGPELAPRLRSLLAERAMLVQPFVADIADRGEISVIVVDGEPTHAVVKRPKAGDFRVQLDHGGTLARWEPAADERDAAVAAVDACPVAPLYARVDLVRGPDGRLQLMELELIEPELFFRFEPSSAQRFAAALARRHGGARRG